MASITQSRLMMAPAFQTTTLGLPLVIVGGWMVSAPGMVLATPFVVAAGLIGAGLLTKWKGAAPVVYAGALLSLLLALGAYFQWQAGNPHATVALGFAASMLLTVLCASVPVEAVRSGMRGLHLLGMGASGWAWYAMTQGGVRVSGPFGINPNALAGFLTIVGLHWLMTQKGWRGVAGAAFVFSGIIFTGSRWAAITLVVGLAILWTIRRLNTRSLAVIGACLLLVALLPMHDTQRAFRISAPTQVIEKGIADAEFRQRVTFTPGWRPKGYIGGDEAGAHNVLTRAAVEAGWLGLALFVSVAAMAFYRGTAATRYTLALLLLLGMMDYYTWGPFQIAPIWWAMVGLGWRRA